MRDGSLIGAALPPTPSDIITVRGCGLFPVRGKDSSVKGTQRSQEAASTAPPSARRGDPQSSKQLGPRGELRGSYLPENQRGGTFSALCLTVLVYLQQVAFEFQAPRNHICIFIGYLLS